LLAHGDGEALGELENAVLHPLLAMVEGATCEGGLRHTGTRGARSARRNRGLIYNSRGTGEIPAVLRHVLQDSLAGV